MFYNKKALHGVFAIAAAALFQPVLCQYQSDVQPDIRTLPEIYEAALAEQKTTTERPLQILMGGDSGDQGDTIREAWKQQYPNLPLNLTVDLSKYHDIRLDLAYLENKDLADVAILQTLQDFPRWKAQNRLLYYKPKHFEDLLGGEKDLDGAWLPTAVYCFGDFFLDTTKVALEAVPNSFKNLTDPFWKGKLILTYPDDDDAVAYLFSIIISRYGVAWLEALAENDVKWVRGAATPFFELSALHNSSSARALTFTSGGFAPWLVRKEVSPPEQIMSWAQNAAILSSTTRPEAAKLFVSFITSKDFINNTSVSYLPTVSNSLNSERGVNAYESNITQLSGFRNFEADRSRVEWWKNLYESIIGPARGPDPLEVYPNPPYMP